MNSKKLEYEEVRDVVFNTLDFCGSVPRAVQEYCKDDGFAFDATAQKYMLDAMQEYHEEAIANRG